MMHCPGGVMALARGRHRGTVTNRSVLFLFLTDGICWRQASCYRRGHLRAQIPSRGHVKLTGQRDPTTASWEGVRRVGMKLAEKLAPIG